MTMEDFHEGKTNKIVFITHICLRIVAFVTALAASWKMFVSKQTVILFGIPFEARYSYTPAFKYFAYINAFVACFVFLSMLCLFIFKRRGFTPKSYFSLFLHDLLLMSLLLSSVSAGTAIGYLGRYGNSHAGWLKICNNLPDFCDKVSTSIVLSYVAVICLLLLTILSASKSG